MASDHKGMWPGRRPDGEAAEPPMASGKPSGGPPMVWAEPPPGLAEPSKESAEPHRGRRSRSKARRVVHKAVAEGMTFVADLSARSGHIVGG